MVNTTHGIPLDWDFSFTSNGAVQWIKERENISREKATKKFTFFVSELRVLIPVFAHKKTKVRHRLKIDDKHYYTFQISAETQEHRERMLSEMKRFKDAQKQMQAAYALFKQTRDRDIQERQRKADLERITGDELSSALSRMISQEEKSTRGSPATTRERRKSRMSLDTDTGELDTDMHRLMHSDTDASPRRRRRRNLSDPANSSATMSPASSRRSRLVTMHSGQLTSASSFLPMLLASDPSAPEMRQLSEGQQDIVRELQDEGQLIKQLERQTQLNKAKKEKLERELVKAQKILELLQQSEERNADKLLSIIMPDEEIDAELVNKQSKTPKKKRKKGLTRKSKDKQAIESNRRQVSASAVDLWVSKQSELAVQDLKRRESAPGLIRAAILKYPEESEEEDNGDREGESEEPLSATEEEKAELVHKLIDSCQALLRRNFELELKLKENEIRSKIMEDFVTQQLLHDSPKGTSAQNGNEMPAATTQKREEDETDMTQESLINSSLAEYATAGDILSTSAMTSQIAQPDTFCGFECQSTTANGNDAPGPEDALEQYKKEDANATQFLCAIKGDDLILEGPIGSGAFGHVYKAEWRGCAVAVKQLIAPLDVQQHHHFIQEAVFMGRVSNHPNIATFYGVSSLPLALKGSAIMSGAAEKHYCIVTEYYENGSVDTYLKKYKETVTWQQIVYIARGAAAGVLHLHKERVIHRDLAARNLLLDATLNVRVADFGLARTKVHAYAMTNGNLGSIKWLAPEAITNQYSEKSDVYSFGIVLWELAMRGIEPYAGENLLQVALGVAKDGKRPPVPANCPKEYLALMQRCWAQDPLQRPDFVDIWRCLDLYLTTLTLDNSAGKKLKT